MMAALIGSDRFGQASISKAMSGAVQRSVDVSALIIAPLGWWKTLLSRRIRHRFESYWVYSALPDSFANRHSANAS